MATETKIQESPEKEKGLLSTGERAVLSQIATNEPPYGARAQALLAIDDGTPQTEAARQAGLTHGQVRYWLIKFRAERTAAFPEELLNQAQREKGVEEAQQALPDAEESAGAVDEAPPQEEVASKPKKKAKKKAKKKSTKKTKKKSKKKSAKKPKKKSKKKSRKKPKKKSEKGNKPAKKSKK